MGPLIDLAEAVRAEWVELWYQPKIDVQAMVMLGAEGLLRVRHPSLGILPPSYCIANDRDPRLRSLSDVVIKRAIADWYRFVETGFVELAINLPLAFLQDAEAVDCLYQSLPQHALFEGLIVEIDGTDIVRNLKFAREIARAFRTRKIAISLDGVGREWPLLTGLRDFPFVEIKVDPNFVRGCANDASKQAMCCRILDLANGYGARTVAEGVETWADFFAVREMGFDLVQGFLFSKPVPAEEFVRTCWTAARHCQSVTRSHSQGALSNPVTHHSHSKGSQ
jgi:EAL domain-containing protein (putative c-di-GMP-specific phosphodiesterase class I)